MNKKQKEVIQAQLDAEKAVLKKLETQYQRALHDINQKVKLFDSDIKGLDALLNLDDLDETRKATLESMKQAKIYQKQYQQALQKQVDGILDKLHGDTYSTVEQYLKECYHDGFLGTMYDIQGQGVPIVVPIDQQSVTKAVVLDSKVVKGYYDALGVDFDRLKKVIPAEVSRGIASSLPYIDIARNINNASKSGLYNAVRIARTEGHRIQQSATYDAQKAAKAKGADVVKQWDSTLDGRTRPSHRKLDGQIREVDEPFEVGGLKAMMPGDFGRPEEDINCRCVSLTRAKWALDEDELQTLRERAAFFDLDKTKDFEDFKKKYNIAAEQMGSEPYDITEGGRYTHLTTSDKNEYADFIEVDYTTQKASVKEVNQLWAKDGGYIQNSQGYSDINNYMRGLKPRLDNMRCKFTMNIMKRLTENNYLKDDYIGFRKVDKSYLTNVLGLDVSGLFKRSFQKNAQGRRREVLVPKDKASAESIAEKIKGLVGTDAGTIKDDAFTSVSLSEGLNYFTHYPIEFKIQMPMGTKGFITSNLDESEFIARNGSSLEIFDAYVYNDGGKDCVIVLARMKQ